MTGQEMRPGLPAVELRRAWQFWEEQIYGRAALGIDSHIDSNGVGAPNAGLTWAGTLWRPFGATWSEVEALAAKGAEITAEVTP